MDFKQFLAFCLGIFWHALTFMFTHCDFPARVGFSDEKKGDSLG